MNHDVSLLRPIYDSVFFIVVLSALFVAKWAKPKQRKNNKTQKNSF